MEKLNFKDFLRVFETSENMPRDKNGLMVKLFTYYNAGIRNENNRIKYNIINSLTK